MQTFRCVPLAMADLSGGCTSAGKPPTRRGSQHRRTCEPAGHSYPSTGWTALEGNRVLTETPPGPYCRDLDAKPEAAPAK